MTPIFELLYGYRPPFQPYYCRRCGMPVVEHNAEEKCPCGSYGAQHMRPEDNKTSAEERA